jgi:hypothetical protein
MSKATAIRGNAIALTFSGVRLIKKRTDSNKRIGVIKCINQALPPALSAYSTASQIKDTDR